MATSKKPPKKKLPTGPTKADLLSRMGVNRQPEPFAPSPPDAVGMAAPGHLESAPTPVEDPPHPPESGVDPVDPGEVEPILPVPALAEPPQEPIPLLAIAASVPEMSLPDADLWPDPPPDPVEVEEIASPVLSPPVHRAEWVNTVLQAELLPPASARTHNGHSNGNGAHRNGAHPGQTLQPDPLPLPLTPKPAAALPDPRDALDAQLGLQKLTLKCSADMLEKLGSLQNATGLPGEILIEVLLDHWEQLPKPVQQDCLMQAHRIRVERLVISQNHTIATIEQLLNEQNLL
ncbi:MAG: hypothetical protein SNJ68_08215 [Cyanobacteriota bacterium]